MFEVAHSSVRRWVKRNEWSVAGAVAVNCPHCGEIVTFTPGPWHDDPVTHTVSFRSACPACEVPVDFWTVHPVAWKEEPVGVHVLMEPSPFTRQPMEGSDSLGSALSREYGNMLRAYNARIWDSAATNCRRVMECIIADKVGESGKHKPLYEGIKELSTSAELADPLIDLSDKLRKGGNLGAHFTGDRSTDRETAEIMVSLSEYIIEYMYILPARVSDLEARLATATDNTSEAEAN